MVLRHPPLHTPLHFSRTIGRKPGCLLNVDDWSFALPIALAVLVIRERKLDRSKLIELGDGYTSTSDVMNSR